LRNEPRSRCEEVPAAGGSGPPVYPAHARDRSPTALQSSSRYESNILSRTLKRSPGFNARAAPFLGVTCTKPAGVTLYVILQMRRGGRDSIRHRTRPDESIISTDATLSHELSRFSASPKQPNKTSVSSSNTKGGNRFSMDESSSAVRRSIAARLKRMRLAILNGVIER
jgi:hypothetical protein